MSGIVGSLSEGRINGTIGAGEGIVGIIADTRSLAASLAVGGIVGSIRGSADMSGQLRGSIDIAASMGVGDVTLANYPDYTGSMSVLPGMAAQYIPTDERVVRGNIRIDGVPAYETSNPQGGVTFTIG